MRRKGILKVLIFSLLISMCILLSGCGEEKVESKKEVKKDDNLEFQEPMNIEEGNITEEELEEIKSINFEEFINKYKEFSSSIMKLTNELMASTEAINEAACEELINEANLKQDELLEIAPSFLSEKIKEYYNEYNIFYSKVLSEGKYSMEFYTDFSNVDNLRYNIDNILLSAIQKLELNISLY